MQIRVLGCSGGICRGVATTSFLIDKDILIDAGTGVSELTLEEMHDIRHIFITHSHLDHIASIPLLADTLFDSLVGAPLILHAQAQTLEVLQKHIFNSNVWPDFTVLPDKRNAVISLDTMQPGTIVEIDARLIEMIAVNHVVAGVGYRIESKGKSFAFSGDTTTNETLWTALNQHDRLDLLFIESAFADKDIELARLAHHYCPQLLAQDLSRLRHRPEIGISHLKPGEEKIIMQQCREALPDWNLQQLKHGDVFRL